MQDLFGATNNGSVSPGSVGLKGIVKAGTVKSGTPSYSDVQYRSFDTGGGKSKAERSNDQKKMRDLQDEVTLLKHQLATQKVELSQNALTASSESKAKGLTEGEAQGEAKATAQFDGQLSEIKSQLGELLQSLSLEKEAFFKQVELGTKTLLTEGLAKLNHELDTRSEDLLQKVVTEVFSILGNESELVLKLNPEDYNIHKDGAHFWLPLESSQVSLKVTEDPRIQKGGCRLETEAGSIDARREMMVAKLSQIIELAFDQMFDGSTEDEAAITAEEVQQVNEAPNE